jgi:hypothetical protein
MAITRSNSGLDVVLDAGRKIFHQKRDQMKQALAKRDLNDLGIPRSNIKRLAMEAAYDC